MVSKVAPGIASPDRPVAVEREVDVGLLLGGRRVAFTMPRDGTTVLEAAEAAGVDWPFQCRSGICSTCRGRLLSGKVTLIENMILDDGELADGYILVCQSLPLSDAIEVELEDW